MHSTYLRRAGAALLPCALTAALLAGCSSGNDKDASAASSAAARPTASSPASAAPAAAAPSAAETAIDEQPSSVYYEIFVRSFYDSNGDGIGDLKGITEKLDYLNDGNPDTHDDLGVGGIWLMPINPSPSYHGYDVTDYRSVNPDYGTVEDLRELVAEAHKRGIKVIMDLVVNHTSSEHPWFKAAATDPKSPYRDWYVWAEDQGRSPEGVSAAGSGNPWHSVRGSHYMATFWEKMPDLNFDNPKVREEMKSVGKFWLDQGLDGFRLDAAKHIYEDTAADRGDATTAKNVAWWQEFRSSLTAVNPNVYLVGEVWEDSAATVGAYLNKAFDSGFNFGLSESILSAAGSEKDNGLAFSLERTYKLYGKVSEGSFTDATFLGNHDVNRSMTQLQDNANHARMAAAIQLTLPGNPFIYYGEEIGMRGQKPDEGIREPMQWYPSGSGQGQTTWEQAANNPAGGASVESENQKADSLLSHYRKLIALRESTPALRDGAVKEYSPGHPGVMAYERIAADGRALVVHNLTGSSQTVKLEKTADGVLYASVLGDTSGQASLKDGSLSLPAYTTVVLQP
ncbi:alpha-amylase family glycosyl hydrolase [Paenibacillus glufosinatiresistens]|uniref:alpha-amylase family glycosyl hydrolase n=1 Tax=Paenibacillus glufosinatiresistens TaxID=3070657 RepID=UPI00286D9190|nr:alpha-amylase family glycosyl hydrolase [Paenibacillus sp. YX.27]